MIQIPKVRTVFFISAWVSRACRQSCSEESAEPTASFLLPGCDLNARGATQKSPPLGSLTKGQHLQLLG